MADGDETVPVTGERAVTDSSVGAGHAATAGAGSPGEGSRNVDQAAVLVVAAGLALSVGLMVAGLAVWGWTGDEGVGGGHDPRRMLREGFAGDATGLISLGILVLLTTPVIRVGLLAAGFGRRREWLFTALAGVVLAELVLSAVLVAAR